jgi:uncharacterized protein with gpF-like domain
LKYPPNTIIANIQTNNQPINPDLYNHYAAGLRKGIDNTFFEDSNSGLSDLMRANVSRFAAYKAAHVTTALKSILNDNSMTVKERDAYAKKALKVFQNRQVTEQATAIARARTAKQFEEFLSDDNNRLFPNLRWLPSSAVIPRSSHMEFYHRVWAKTDPFWATNSPGQEWNCQCDIEETSDGETNNAAVPQPRPKKGLEGNPGIKEINGEPNPYYGQAFTDKASYIARAGGSETERKPIEQDCQKAYRDQLQKDKALYERLKHTTIKYGDEENGIDIGFCRLGLNEYIRAQVGTDWYWQKNEVLLNISQYINKMTYADSKKTDATHNKGKTKNFKKSSDMFFYYKIALPSGKEVYLNFARMNSAQHNAGTLTLWTVTEDIGIKKRKRSKP